MSVPDVAYFTTADVDLLVGFLDSIHVEFGAEARRDGIISIQVRRVGRDRNVPYRYAGMIHLILSWVQGSTTTVISRDAVARFWLPATRYLVHKL